MEIIALFTAGASAVAAIAAAWAAYRTYQATQNTFQENRNLVYLQFYQLIARHHSEEMTALRRTVRTELKVKAEEAIKQNKTLFQLDPEFHLKVSALANYYEALGMFLEGNWNYFPQEVQETMKKMLHNSVTNHWEGIQKYKAQIHPTAPRDWAGSFQWLNEIMLDYKREKTL
jgi:hypothetical protein